MILFLEMHSKLFNGRQEQLGESLPGRALREANAYSKHMDIYEDVL